MCLSRWMPPIWRCFCGVGCQYFQARCHRHCHQRDCKSLLYYHQYRFAYQGFRHHAGCLASAMKYPAAHVAMATTAENVAAKYGITREEQDVLAMRATSRRPRLRPRACVPTSQWRLWPSCPPYSRKPVPLPPAMPLR